jgi:hypothetical protein
MMSSGRKLYNRVNEELREDSHRKDSRHGCVDENPLPVWGSYSTICLVNWEYPFP